MIEQGLFKRHFVGRDGFHWWIGQVAPEESWSGNKTGVINENNNSEAGFGERYRVRILGYHTANAEDIPDEELPFAYVMYPVTAGGGGRGSSASANITQGTFVFGWFIDGEDGQIPIIMGCLGYNDYNAVMKSVTPTRFIPFDGYPQNDEVMGQKRSTLSIRETGGDEILQQENGQGQSVNEQYTSSAEQNTSLSTLNDREIDEDGLREEALQKTSQCEKVPQSTLMKSLINMMNDVHRLNRILQDERGALSEGTTDIQSHINTSVAGASKEIAGAMKWVLSEMEKNVFGKVNNQVKVMFSSVFPDQREQLREATTTMNDVIACVFRQLMVSLPAMIDEFLGEMTGGAGGPSKAINVPQCFIQDFLGNAFGSIAGKITNAISDALGSFDSIVGQVSQTIGDVLGFIGDLLAFLTCGGLNDTQCPEVDGWSIFSGASSSGGPDITGLIDSFKRGQSNAERTNRNISNIDGDGDWDNFDFGDVFRNSLCDLGPRSCSTPTLNFNGPGALAAGNAIVSSSGEIMGIDLINSGVGYVAGRSFARIYDDCGKGKGAVLRPVFGSVVEEDGVYVPSVGSSDSIGIIDVIVEEPGYGYLPSPDGSLGGDGTVWANPQDTIIIGESDGSPDYYPPIRPGNNGTVPPGGTVTTPPNSGSTEIVDEDGNAEEVLPGVPTFSENGGTITAPTIDLSLTDINVDVTLNQRYPSLGGSNSYPVVLYLCEVIVQDSGLGYKDTDPIIIEPNYGAKAEPKFDDFGRLMSVKVTAGGEGFQEVPKVYIETQTGFGADMIPKFCIDRLGSDDLERDPSLQDKVVSVVDCVGKVV